MRPWQKPLAGEETGSCPGGRHRGPQPLVLWKIKAGAGCRQLACLRGSVDKGKGWGAKQIWPWIPALPFTCRVASG